MRPALIIADDRVWAHRTAERFERFMEGSPAARLLLPTGATVEPFYEKVATMVPFAEATVFLLDEFGGLPEEDPGRCRSMLQRHLLDRMEVPPRRVHVPNVDADDLAAECDRYRSLLSDGIDLAILGLGGNGHVGMNEPGSGEASPTRVVGLDISTSVHAAEYGATALPTWGITVGFREIMSAAHVWLFVTGEHKRDILARTLHDPIGPDLPATWLRNHPRLTVFADYSAAATFISAR